MLCQTNVYLSINTNGNGELRHSLKDAIRYHRPARHYPPGLYAQHWKRTILFNTTRASKQAPIIGVFETSSIQRLQRHPIILLALKRHPQLKQLDNDVAEFLEEDPIILGVPLDVLLEARVLDERHVRRQHHERLAPHVLVLLRPVPLLPRPLLPQQQAEVVVRDDGRGEGPGAVEAGAVGVAAAEGVGAGQGDDLPVVEAHAVEDGAEVGLLFGPVGEAAVGRAHGYVPGGAAGAPGDGGALHFLDGADAGEGPEVRVGYPGVFGWEWGIRRVWRGYRGKGWVPLTGSRKSRAAFKPAFAPWSPSGAKRMVAPFEPPVLVSLS